jgi:hypothetical protein
MTGQDRKRKERGKERREERVGLGSPREAFLLLAPVQCTSFLCRDGRERHAGRKNQVTQTSCADLVSES